MSEEAMVRNCAPTLAGIKTGNLFSYRYDSTEQMRESLRFWNRRLHDKGVRILPLRYCNNQALIYLYRPAHLANDLHDDEAKALLRDCGYVPEYAGQCIVRLMQRLRESDDFPHEIGLFLGYPPEDVSGFITQHACGYKCAGCWKVYGDEAKCRRLFMQYKQCTRLYEDCLKCGTDVVSMTVSDKGGAKC
ncbi:MAG: DUF3793 family protein [Oscillospiraceae bacterium]|nr:DUF3793 family protein [Oscillospiraceae bacterium]